jgi:predicted AAA+ superfamily ATPase
MTAYLTRDITSTVLSALKDMPVVVITGMRQTGKTTLLRHEHKLEHRRYITFDDFAQLQAAKMDPDGFIQSQGPVTIDEAHKCPEIFVAIKKAVDKERIPGRFLLSGSANFSLLKTISESMAGRAVYFALHPFSRRELGEETVSKPFIRQFFETKKTPRSTTYKPIGFEEILAGGMPTVALGEVRNRVLWFKGFEQTYLERDVQQLSQIGNIIAFRNLLRLAALRTGQLLSPSSLGRDAKMNVATTSRYLSLLEASFVIYRLSPYLRNKASRLIKSAKMYMTDSGLCAYLTGIQSLTSPSEEPLFGSLFETYVAQNLLGILDSRWPEARLHFWSVQGRHEVDFVIEAQRHCLAIETKAAARWDPNDLSGLKAFLSATPHCQGAILAYNGPEAVQLGDKLWALPLSLVLS